MAGCDRSDDRTAGERVDSATTSAGNAAERTGDAIENAAERTGNAIENASERAAANIDDAQITASVNTELAKDDRLSALKIDVDTDAGRVVLKGTAPDAASRDRATEIASRIDGVKGVDNQLRIDG
ncbi:MAG: BON domain-containing protein [Comamonadaceae bacterium]|nr:BON domain-containing protein [Comamonadaceae bacterium]